MFKAATVEKAIEARALRDDRHVSHEQMALLLYWAYGWTLSNKGSRLIRGGMVASEYGPVPKYWEHFSSSVHLDAVHEQTDAIEWIVESTWVSLSRVPRPVLLSMTTGRGSAWRTVVERNQGDVSKRPEIRDGLILAEFQRRIDRTFAGRKKDTMRIANASLDLVLK